MASQEEKARKFLEKLRDDSKFRERFQKNPAKTLEDEDLAFDKTKLPAEPVNLPSSEEIDQNLDAMSRDLAATMGIIFFSK